MTVNSNDWQRFAIADRDQSFNADQAIMRIHEWADGSDEKYATAFLWKNPQGPPLSREGYRLPVIDIIDGRPMLVPHAVFTAAAILSGAHGGLEGVVGEEEKRRLKGVVTNIYDKLRETYDDPRVKPPWLRGGNDAEDVTASLVASVNSEGWSSLPIADTDRQWDGDAARDALWSWADGDFDRYRRGFLWWDSQEPELKGSYKLPIATIIDGELTIVPRAVNAVASVLAGGRGGVDIPTEDRQRISGIVNRIQERFQSDDDDDDDDARSASGIYGDDDDESRTASGGPLMPPAEWFNDPQLPGPTPISVTADGRVFGHLAAWGQCHMRFSDRCVTTPRSAIDYKLFRNGEVLTADGSLVKVGKITLGTGHASPVLGWIPAADHYDNTGTAVAVVASGEDRHGVWVAGSILPGVSDEKVAELRRSPLSGDWRRFEGNLELVAALAVNVPGYPILNLTASGEEHALCAAGVIGLDGQVASTEWEPKLPEDLQKMVDRFNGIQAFVTKLLNQKRRQRFEYLTASWRREQ